MAGAGPSRARHRARDLLVKALYQWQATHHDFDELVEQFSATSDYARADQLYFKQLLGIVLEETEELDRSISRYAVRGIEQLDVVGRMILRLSFAELRHRPDVPAKVVINEAVELAKRYGAPDTFRFVNAVLDRAAKAGRTAGAGAGGTNGTGAGGTNGTGAGGTNGTGAGGTNGSGAGVGGTSGSGVGDADTNGGSAVQRPEAGNGPGAK